MACVDQTRAMEQAACIDRHALAVQVLELRADDRVVEIGCGPGLTAQRICQRLAEGRLTAVDRSASALSRATKRNEAAIAGGRMRTVQGEFGAVKLPDSAFEKFVAVNVNAFWALPGDRLFTAARDLLRSEGTACLVYEGPPRAKATDFDLKMECLAPKFRSNGFEAIETMSLNIKDRPVYAIRAKLSAGG